MGSKWHLYRKIYGQYCHCHSTNKKDHIEAVMDVLQVAEDNDLYFKPEKCIFHAPHINYLGVILEKGMIHMDLVKIEGIKNWPMPTKVKDVRSFLGFCNFYQPFIPKFGHDVKPLNKLTKKDAPWQWGKHQQEAMDNLKAKVTRAPVLQSPELDKQFEVEVNVSGYAIGAVLLQHKEDNKKHPIVYYCYAQGERTVRLGAFECEGGSSDTCLATAVSGDG